MLIALPAPQLLEITGPDARAFAQAQFSSDVATLETGRWQWSAWLNAQGRVRAFFHLLRTGDDTLWSLLRGGDAARLRDALARYVLRAKVTLRVIGGMQAIVAPDQPEIPDTPLGPCEDMIAIAGGRLCLALPGAPSRWLIVASNAQPLALDNSETARNRAALADIDAGLAWLDPALEESLLPQWLRLDALGATSVRKGCYPGQEVVARLHFKGGNKRGLYRIGYQAATLPAPGTEVTADGAGQGGIVVQAAWREPGGVAALAVLHDDAAAATAGLSVGQCRIETTDRAMPSVMSGIA